MIMGKKDRYFYPTKYNMVRVVGRLAEIVKEQGGTAKKHSDELLIHLRGRDGVVLDTSPVVKTNFVSNFGDLWIRFELDGYRYYFQSESNPYFPDGFIKKPVDWTGEAFLDKIESADKSWMTDEMFSDSADDNAIEDSAKRLLKQLRNIPATVKR